MMATVPLRSGQSAQGQSDAGPPLPKGSCSAVHFIFLQGSLFLCDKNEPFHPLPCPLPASSLLKLRFQLMQPKSSGSPIVLNYEDHWFSLLPSADHRPGLCIDMALHLGTSKPVPKKRLNSFDYVGRAYCLWLADLH